MSFKRLLLAGAGMMSLAIAVSGCSGEPKQSEGAATTAPPATAVKPAAPGSAPPVGAGSMSGGQPMTPRPASGAGSISQ